jgi:hypothetical protein
MTRNASGFRVMGRRGTLPHLGRHTAGWLRARGEPHADVKTGLGGWSEEAFVTRFKAMAERPDVELKSTAQRRRNTVMPWKLLPYATALVYLGLDEIETAFEWLERAFAVRDVHLIFLPVDPKWDPLRSETRLRELERRCGFGLTA